VLTDVEVATVLEPPLTVLNPKTESVAPAEKRRTKVALLFCPGEVEVEVEEAGGGLV
jgi:hypothetical protein